MADEKKSMSKHTVVMTERENIAITGVSDVISFDEETVVAETDQGVLVLRGENLHVTKLNLEKGELDIEGEILSLTYEETNGFGKNKTSFLGKIFK